jgi:hypothetical protein
MPQGTGGVAVGIEITRNESAWSGNGPKGHYYARLGPFNVTRPTRKEAHDALVSLVEEAISGSFEPAMLAYGSGRVLVYRDMGGWCVRHCSDLAAFSTDGTTMTCGRDTRDRVIHGAKLYLAQCQYPEYNGLDLLAGDADAIRQHCHWLGFQRAYESARTYGMTDHEAHAYACRNADATGSWLTATERAILEAVCEPEGGDRENQLSDNLRRIAGEGVPFDG